MLPLLRTKIFPASGLRETAYKREKVLLRIMLCAFYVSQVFSLHASPEFVLVHEGNETVSAVCVLKGIELVALLVFAVFH
jgi:hypothetical protein